MSNQPEENLKKSTRMPWGSIGILLSAFALIVLIYMFAFVCYRLTVVNKTLATSISALQTKLADSQNDSAILQTNLNTLTKTMDVETQSINELKQMQGGNKEVWAVLEAQYQTKLASNYLQFENNAVFALELLKMADKEIQNISDPKLSAVREALASDIAALEAVPLVDVTGTYFKLAALNKQVDQLALPAKQLTPETQAISETNATHLPWWKRGLESAWQGLKQIVVVRHHNNEVFTLLTPDQQTFFYLNLHAVFEKTMWALLHHNAEIYRDSLQASSDWIKKYFVVNAADTQSVLNNLNQLQQININPNLPKNLNSLQAFHDYFAGSAK